jgi:serine/threonine protein kinase
MLNEVIKQYFSDNESFSTLPFGNGHINDTFKVDALNQKRSYILQKINTRVFPDPKGIVENHLKLQNLLFSVEQPISIARIIPNSMGQYLSYDKLLGAWRLTEFIADSYSINLVKHHWQAFESGRAFGCFAKICSPLNSNEFSEAIKDFHRLSFRINQLNNAIDTDRFGRLGSAQNLVSYYKDKEDIFKVIEELVDEGAILTRVIHNDTKIDNVLFRGEKAVAIIDLDTLGPGILYYDYGDALRTIACSSLEDEKDISKVHFNFKAFFHFSLGYLDQIKGIVTDAEKSYFYLAPMLLTFIMGIRFLTDYLNGDVYYKISYSNHNIDRSKVQMALLSSMEGFEHQMKESIDRILS